MTSRAKLYALGEPLGDSATRIEPGRRIYGGGGGSSSSSSAQTTNNTDKRIAVETGMGISSDQSTINVTTLDAGIVAKALDTVSAADATNGQGFEKLLSLAEKLFEGGSSILETGQKTTLAQVAALNTAANDAKGAIDQKTMVMIVGAAAAAAVLVAGKKKG